MFQTTIFFLSKTLLPIFSFLPVIKNMFSFLHFNFISSEGIVIGINVSFINCSINKRFQMLHMLGYCICLISRFIKKFFKIRNEIIG